MEVHPIDLRLLERDIVDVKLKEVELEMDNFVGLVVVAVVMF